MTRIYLPPAQAWTFARLPAVLAEHGIDAVAVTHVGAHHGEEVPVYRRCGFRRIVLVEPDPRNLVVLHERVRDEPDVSVVAAAATPAPAGEQTLYLCERTVLSGLVPHPDATGDTVQVRTVALADLHPTNLLVLDSQGTELDLLRVADLDVLDLVVVETSRRRDDGCAYYDDAVSHMDAQGWVLAEEWVHDGSGITDTVFVRGAR